ncbi:MAG TPA: alpha/beta hydrolase [Desulfobulbaceae bacterium]|nr:alpha/beta hydrolase [Desulfobulbaceae bacterium]
MNILVNGVSLFYEKSGAGPSLLLLHGNGEDHHIFDALTAKLRHHFTLYAIDSRNHGQSEKTADYSYDSMAGDIHQFIAVLGLEKPHILGFSDGAITTLLLAMRHGEMLGKLALLGINLKPEDFTEENYRFVRETYEETGDPLYKMMLEQPNITLDETRLATNPTFIVAAEHDLFKPETFSELAKAMPNARLVTMAGHTHDSYINGQDILYPDLSRFFTGARQN